MLPAASTVAAQRAAARGDDPWAPGAALHRLVQALGMQRSCVLIDCAATQPQLASASWCSHRMSGAHGRRRPQAAPRPKLRQTPFALVSALCCTPICYNSADLQLSGQSALPKHGWCRRHAARWGGGGDTALALVGAGLAICGSSLALGTVACLALHPVLLREALGCRAGLYLLFPAPAAPLRRAMAAATSCSAHVQSQPLRQQQQQRPRQRRAAVAAAQRRVLVCRAAKQQAHTTVR